MKKLTFLVMVLAIAGALVACSNIFTYVRHEESTGNVECSNDKALKRDSVCNVQRMPEQQKQ